MKKVLILIGLVMFCLVSYGQTIEKITYENKVNLRPIVDRTKQSTAEDWNEVKAKFNSLVDYLEDTALTVVEVDPVYSAEKPDIIDRLDNLDAIAGDKKVTSGDTLLTLEQYRLLASGSGKTIWHITLPYSTTVAGRIALAVSGVDYPSGWTLTADGLNLVVTHNLTRWASNVAVFAKTTGTQRQQLFNTAAYNGITCLSPNVLTIYSLATISKDIVIYLNFE